MRSHAAMRSLLAAVCLAAFGGALAAPPKAPVTQPATREDTRIADNASAGSDASSERKWGSLGFHGEWVSEPPVSHDVRLEKLPRQAKCRNCRGQRRK